jgi:HKD family nuclease
MEISNSIRAKRYEMDFDFIDNVRTKLSDTLTSIFPGSKTAKIAVAFAKQTGFKLIERPLSDCLDHGGNVEFVIGLDFRTTDAAVLQSFHSLTAAYPNFSFYCFSDPSDYAVAYHPKLYLFQDEALVRGVVGSSNLTKGGLSENVELNVLLEMEQDSEKADRLFDIFAYIKYQPSRFVPDDEYIQAYRAILEKNQQPWGRRGDTRKEVDRLREVERNLPKPYIKPSALQGWQKLVFSKLPEDEFQTSDLYQYAQDFAQLYPENRNIEPKIRQVLQQLRDLGVILHLEEGRWKKIILPNK